MAEAIEVIESVEEALAVEGGRAEKPRRAERLNEILDVAPDGSHLRFVGKHWYGEFCMGCRGYGTKYVLASYRDHTLAPEKCQTVLCYCKSCFARKFGGEQ